MPTADEYRHAAADFDRLARAASTALGPRALCVVGDAGPIGRGRTVLREAIAEICAGGRTTAAGYVAVAAECRRRAVLCDDYVRALEAHRRSVTAWERATPAERLALTIVPPPHRELWMSAP